ncbi:hypothetical protein Avbf_02706 [Armadillidium vulgare]|nr:hypothetical protein Avbf_02706 [Armadillidium vulgare]
MNSYLRDFKNNFNSSLKSENKDLNHRTYTLFTIDISSQSIQLNKSYSINSSNIDRSLFRRGFSLSKKAFTDLFCPSEQLSGKVLS